MKDPYKVLGVAKTATQDEIKAAYRSLAKKIHPDLNPGNKVAEEKFKDASAAYERIGTAEERAKFDRGETEEQLQAAQREQAKRYAQQPSSGRARGAPGGGGPFYHETQQGGDGGRYSQSFGQDFGGDEFFENLFRAAGQTRGGRRGESSIDYPGEDALYQMGVDFRDSVLGAEHEITLPTGKRLKVKIPPGVETGSKLRFKGQGEPGVGKGPAGDAYVEITVRPLAGFKRVGSDIETEVPVSFFEALLGAEIKVPTLEGSVMLKVPPGVSTGSRLRVRGKGVALPKSPGDQIVVLKVAMPKKASPGLESAMRDLAGKFAYHPRGGVMKSKLKPTHPLAEAAEECGLSVEVIARFIAFAWIVPADEEHDALDEEDVARARLIWHLQHEFGVNDDAVPIILHLIDQLNRIQTSVSQIR